MLSFCKDPVVQATSLTNSVKKSVCPHTVNAYIVQVPGELPKQTEA